MVVLADQGAELISLGGVRNRDSTGIKVGLEAGLGPRVDCLVEGVLDCKRSVVGRLGVLVASLGGSSTKRRRSCGGSGVTDDLGAVLADKCAKLVQLSSLGYYAGKNQSETIVFGH